MPYFPTDKTEGMKMMLKRWGLNLFPAYRSTTAWVTFISDDWREIQIELSLNWVTRNYVGSIFGGSLFAALDPMYMIQLINILGNQYVVWDKAASIRFKRPGKSRLYARFLISEELTNNIVKQVATENEMTLALPISFVNKEGKVICEMTRELYIANKDFFKKKRSAKEK